MQGPRLRLYVRQDCELCEDMWKQLVSEGSGRLFELELIDIAIEKQYNERFGGLIPVLEADGEVICHYYLDREALQRHLSSVPGGTV